MEDVAVRSRYPRRNLQGGRRRKSIREKSSMAESIFRQLVLSILILVAVGIVKSVDTPVTNFLSDKIRTVVFQNIELQSIYEGIDGMVKKATAVIQGKATPGTEQSSVSTDGTKNANVNNAVPASATPNVQGNDSAGSIDYWGGIEEELVQPETENPGTAAVQQEVSRGGDTADKAVTEKNAATKNTAAKKVSMIAPTDGTLESPFGNRTHPVKKTPEFHRGVDIAANKGVSVKDVLDGEVTVAGYDSGYGNYVKIQHADGLVTLYAHCSVLSVEKGQTVKQGAVIAKVGDTGDSIGPHLHFEVWKDGKAMDPLSFVKIRRK